MSSTNDLIKISVIQRIQYYVSDYLIFHVYFSLDRSSVIQYLKVDSSCFFFFFTSAFSEWKCFSTFSEDGARCYNRLYRIKVLGLPRISHLKPKAKTEGSVAH